MIVMAKKRRMARSISPVVSVFRGSGADDDHNRDTEADRGKKSPAPAHRIIPPNSRRGRGEGRPKAPKQ